MKQIDSLSDLQKKVDKMNAESKFAGANWGVGLALINDFDSDKIVVGDENGAVKDENGYVRVKTDKRTSARILLETHYIFTFKDNYGFLKENIDGHGPFILIQPGNSKFLESFGFGWMLAMRKSEETQQSFNLGIAFIVDPDVTVLGDDIEENQKLPDGEEIRFKTMAQGSFGLIASFTF